MKKLAKRVAAFSAFPDTNVDNLLVAAMAYSGAITGFVFAVEESELSIYAAATYINGKVQANYNSEYLLDDDKVLVVNQVLADGATIRLNLTQPPVPDGTDDHCDRAKKSALCIPMKQGDHTISLLYLETEISGDGFTTEVEDALKLFSQALSLALNLKKTNNDERTHANDEASNVGHQPATYSSKISRPLSDAAKMIAPELTDQLSTVVINASAGLQWLHSRPPDIKKAMQSLRKIAETAFSANAVVSSYSQSATADKIYQSPLDLEEIVTKVIAGLASQLRKRRVEIQMNLSYSKPVYVAAVQAEVILKSILTASIDAMKYVQRPRMLGLSSIETDKYVIVTITDTGLAIPVDILDEAFDPVVSERLGDRGLALAIARTVTLLQRGNLEITKSNDDGTAFRLTLPTTMGH